MDKDASREGLSAALVHQPQEKRLEDDVGLQQLWLATQSRPWRSLAVVAGDDGLSTLGVATRLAEVAWWFRGLPTSVIDLRDLGLRLVPYQLREMEAQIAQGDTVIVALKSIFENPATIAVAQALDAAVLCVRLGATRAQQAEKTLDAIGHERFLGSIVVKGPKEP